MNEKKKYDCYMRLLKSVGCRSTLTNSAVDLVVTIGLNS